MKRVVLIVVAFLVTSGVIVGFVLLTNGNGTPAKQPPLPPDDAGNLEPPADEDPPPEPPPDEPPPDPEPLLTLTSAELSWDIGDAECVAGGETLVPTLTVCVQNDGNGEAEVELLAGVVSDVEGLSGTPYDDTFAAEPLAPGEERCLSATLDPSFLAQSSVPELSSLPDAELIPLELPEMPPLCEPEPVAQPAPAQKESPVLPEGQFTEFIEVHNCRLVGGETYEWYHAIGIFQTLEDGTKAFVDVVEGSEEGPFSGPWQGGCPGGSSGGGDGGGGGGGGDVPKPKPHPHG